MMFLYALLMGGFAAVIGSGSSGGSAAPASAPPPPADDDETPPAADIVIQELDEDEPPAFFAEQPQESFGGGASGGTGSEGAGSDSPELPASAYDIGWEGLSGEEQLIVELINRARMDPASEEIRLDELLASGISRTPVEALAVVPTLSNAAEAHSEDMDNQDYFSHTDTDGGRPWDRAVEAGHENTYVGENIGWIGSSRTTFDEQARAEAHHTNLWESDGHQANLMSGNWSEIGLGYDYGSYQGYDGSTFVTELFGDTGKSYLTGVVIEDEDGDEFYDIGEGQGGVRITAYNDEASYATSTWEAGGYSLALPPGTYTVVFEGGDLDAPYETEITIGNDNVKLDVLDEGGASVISLNAGLPPAPSDDLMTLLMIDQGDDLPLPEEAVEETPELVLF